MDNIDLDSMPLDQLRALRVRIDRAISSFEDRKRREALAAAEEVARQHGFALADLTTAGKRGRRGAARPSGEVRYANPDDATQTWSGRGRRPRWITEQIEAGRDLADMAV